MDAKLHAETRVLETDAKQLFRAEAVRFRELWWEVVGHGYGHASVWHLNLLTVAFVAMAGYWTWLLGHNPLNNDVLFCLWFALFSIWHTRCALAIYNPANWLSSAAFQAWISQLVVGILSIGILLYLLAIHSGDCIRDPQRQGQYCPYDTDPSFRMLSCVQAPARTSPCPSQTRGGAVAFVVFAVIQKILYFAMVSSVMSSMSAYRLRSFELIQAVDATFSKSLPGTTNAAADSAAATATATASAPAPPYTAGRRLINRG